MAIDLPATAQRLNVANFRTETPIRSGQAAGDKAFGFRGVSSEINHVYAQRIQTLCSHRDPDNLAITGTAPVAWGTLAGPFTSEMGANVAKLRAIVDGTDIEVRLVTTLGTSAGSSAVGRATITEVLTLSNSTGIDNAITLQWRQRAGGATFKGYAFLVQEVALVAADIP